MLSDKITEPLLDLDKCSLNKLINILQSFANDPSFNFYQIVLVHTYLIMLSKKR
jgi:hypothetical protein